MQILRDGLEVTDIHPGKGASAAPGDVVKVSRLRARARFFFLSFSLSLSLSLSHIHTTHAW